MKLLKEMCAIHAPSGNEAPMTKFLLNYIDKNKKKWKHKPTVYSGDGFQDCIVLVFGKPRTAVFAHIDSIGFTVRYGNELVKIGGPRTVDVFELVGKDEKGKIECTLAVDKENNITYVPLPMLLCKCDVVSPTSNTTLNPSPEYTFGIFRNAESESGLCQDS